MDEHSLERLEFQRVTARIAALARCEGAAAWLASALPILDRDRRSAENRCLAEAIHRHAEPGPWCEVGPGDLGWRLDEPAAGESPSLDGPGLVEVQRWIEAGEETRGFWSEGDARERHRALGARVAELPELGALLRRLRTSLEPDGRVSDAASPALKRARAERARGERELQQRLEKWGRGFGESSYVTRLGDRFVVLVPAAGFPRRRGLVHDVSASGQSLFVEPIEACESNNRLIELGVTVVEEERRVLAELAAEVRGAAADLRELERVLVHLDTLHARARWASDTGAIALEPGGDRLRLRRARHPLLAAGERRDEVVPLDLDLGHAGRLLLVSGPNMGGKTVLLKTVGLAVALGHAAFPVTADEGSAIPELDQVLVDLGDEQSLDQGLSTFAAHLRSLAQMAEQAGPRTLLICDEMGAGTDPEEGAALGRALIERFSARGAWAIVTTHLGSLKRAAGEVEGVTSGSLEFDDVTLTPRYRFLAGVPGSSHALAMAERLGLDREVLARARAITPDESRALERLIRDLQGTVRRYEEERERLAEARAAAERAAGEQHAAAEESRRTLGELRRRLTAESQVLLSHARELWQTVQREARRAEKTRMGAEQVRAQVTAVEREVRALEVSAEAARASFGAGPDAAPDRLDPAALAPGARVRVVDLDVEAEVVSPPDAEGKVRLKRGSWTINSHLERLAPAGRPEGAAEPRGGRTSTPASVGGSGAVWQVPDEAAALEVDLRGMEVDEALRTLDAGLDRGVLAGLGEIRVIHGIGRGILRSAVERHLREHPQVASHRAGQVGEGGRGVTVARLK